MKHDLNTDVKIGIFALIVIGVLAYITLDVSNVSLTPGATYTVYTFLPSAEGVTKKTPVQIAGIPVGVVSSINLIDNTRARVAMKIKNKVQVTEDMVVNLRSRGVLGDVYLELVPGKQAGAVLENGDTLVNSRLAVDYQDIFETTADISRDLKEITQAMKEYTVSDKSVVSNILQNMEELTKNMVNISNQNSENMRVLVQNLAELSKDLRRLGKDGGAELEEALNRISSITQKIEQGEGTLGRLINDETTIDKTNAILSDVKNLTEPIGRLQLGLDYHMEYLGASSEYKNIINMKFSTHPDKYFLFGVVHDTNPPPSSNTSIETFETGGVTTVVAKETSTFDKIRFNAQLAKTFSDFTIRGGLIESTGGAAVDYIKGPVKVSLQGYNFGNAGQSLKASANLNITNSLYITGGTYLFGGTDSVSGIKYGPDWFLGAGIQFTDQDFTSLLGGAGLFVR